MNKACPRCRPANRLGIMQKRVVRLPDGTSVEEWTSLCDAHRQAAGKENKAGRARRAKVTDLPLLEFLFTAPSREEPAR